MTFIILLAAGVAEPVAVPAAVTAPVVAVQRDQVNGTSTYLPANTQVDVTLNSEVSSKKARTGDAITFSVSHDVMLGNYVVIPKGTPARGAVGYRTGKGAFGKSAKMEIDVTSVELGGRSIPVSGHFRQEGQGNTGATVGTAVAAGVFSAFVTGRSAIFEQGREFRTFTKDALPVALGGQAPVFAASPVQATPVAAVAPVGTTQ